MNKFSLLLILSFAMASVINVQAYRGQEIVNKGLAKGTELLEFVKNSKNAQIGLAVSSFIVTLIYLNGREKVWTLDEIEEILDDMDYK